MVRVNRQKRPVKKRPTKKKTLKKAEILNRIQPVSKRDVFLKVNVYGQSGSGKTTFASTCPKPALIVKFEEGTNSVYDVEGLDDVDILDTSEIKDLVESEEIKKYKTVIIDTATMLQSLILQEILGLDELPAQMSWGLATQQEWQQCTMKSKEFLRAFLGLSTQSHVIILAQERVFNEDSDSEVIRPHIGSALTPSTKGWLDAACDCIVETFKRQKTKTVVQKIGKKTVKKKVPVKGIEYCLKLGPDGVYTTKFRLPKSRELPDVVVNPEFDKILSLVKGE